MLAELFLSSSFGFFRPRRINLFRPLGGISEDNVGQVVGHGARRIVVVRAITAAADPRAAAQRLKAALPPLG